MLIASSDRLPAILPIEGGEAAGPRRREILPALRGLAAGVSQAGASLTGVPRGAARDAGRGASALAIGVHRGAERRGVGEGEELAVGLLQEVDRVAAAGRGERGVAEGGLAPP